MKAWPQINLTESKDPNSNSFDLAISLATSSRQLAPLLDELAIFSFHGGLLHTFRKKQEAYQFIGNIPMAIEQNYKNLDRFFKVSGNRGDVGKAYGFAIKYG